MRPARPWILVLAFAGWPLAHAQAIYRCGDSYSQQPCAGGTQVAPAVAAPSAADRSQAAAAAARDARLAESLEKDRTRREAQAGSAPIVMTPTPTEQAEPHKWPDKAATRKLDLFTASVPGSKKPKAKPAAKAKPEPRADSKADASKEKVKPAPVKTAKASAG